MDEAEVVRQLTRHTEQITSLSSRVDKVERLQGDLTDIKISIERQTGNIDKLAETVKVMADKQQDHENRLDAMEQEPGEMWKQARWLIISTVIGAIIGAIISHLM